MVIINPFNFWKETTQPITYTALSTQLCYSCHTTMNLIHLPTCTPSKQSTRNRKLTWWLLSAGSFTIFWNTLDFVGPLVFRSRGLHQKEQSKAAISNPPLWQLVNKACQFIKWTKSFQDHIYLLRFRLTSWLFCTKVTMNCTICKGENTTVGCFTL